MARAEKEIFSSRCCLGLELQKTNRKINVFAKKKFFSAPPGALKSKKNFFQPKKNFFQHTPIGNRAFMTYEATNYVNDQRAK